MNSIVEVKNVSKVFKIKQKTTGFTSILKSLLIPKYKEIAAVNDISFIVNQGETVSFIGPNGAGKSSTIKMMTGILYPTSGKLKIAGLDPSKDRTKLAYKIGTVFGQKSQLWFHLPAIDTFNLLSKIYGLNNFEYQERLNFLIKSLEVEGLLDIPVRKLSLGQRIRCEIVASLLHRPEIVFLDEPTIGLDAIAKHKVRDILKMMNKKEGITIFLTSHDAGDIEALTKRTIIINHGKIIFDDSTKKLKESYITSKIIEIVFEEEAKDFNFAKGKIISRNTHSIKIEVERSIGVLEELLDYTLENFQVLDINIISPSLEKIISKIYRDSHEK